MRLPPGYTHLASFYGVPCYFNEPDSTLVGRSFVSEFFLLLALGFHFFMWWAFGGLMIQMGAEPSFPIKVKTPETNASGSSVSDVTKDETR